MHKQKNPGSLTSLGGVNLSVLCGDKEGEGESSCTDEQTGRHCLYSSVSVILSSPVGPFTTCLACVTGTGWEFSQLQHNRKIRFHALAQRRLVFITEATAPALLRLVIEM